MTIHEARFTKITLEYVFFCRSLILIVCFFIQQSTLGGTVCNQYNFTNVLLLQPEPNHFNAFLT